MKILFVCSGNTCRSAMAEGYFNNLLRMSGEKHAGHAAVSAGTHASPGLPASENACSVMEKYGIDLSRHRSRPFTRRDAEAASLIAAMTPAHLDRILAAAPSCAGKTRLLLEFTGRDDEGVADPYGGTKEVYERCFMEMKGALDNLFLDIMNGIIK